MAAMQIPQIGLSVTMRQMNPYRAGCVAALIAVVSAGCAQESKLPAPAAETAKPRAVEAPPQIAQVAHDAPVTSVAKVDLGPQQHTAFYGADTAATKIPAVSFSKREKGLNKVNVGDAMPTIELPQVDGGKAAKLADLLGKKATVVVFWKGDRRMALEQLTDLGPDVIEPFGKDGVAVIGIAVKETAASATEFLTKAGAKFTNLLDADGKAFTQIGSERLPRTYVLDPSGKIVWFDIEYSLATRRELHEALRFLTGKQ
jgi:peroxiredoxin